MTGVVVHQRGPETFRPRVREEPPSEGIGERERARKDKRKRRDSFIANSFLGAKNN